LVSVLTSRCMIRKGMDFQAGGNRKNNRKEVINMIIIAIAVATVVFICT